MGLGKNDVETKISNHFCTITGVNYIIHIENYLIL